MVWPAVIESRTTCHDDHAHGMRRNTKAGLVILLAAVSLAAFALLAPVVPTTVGSQHYCTPQQVSAHDFSWGHGGCFSVGYASLTYVALGYGAYFTLGAYVPPIQKGV